MSLRSIVRTQFASGDVLHFATHGVPYTGIVSSLNPAAMTLRVVLPQNAVPSIHVHANEGTCLECDTCMHGDGHDGACDPLEMHVSMRECIVPSMAIATPQGTSRVLGEINRHWRWRGVAAGVPVPFDALQIDRLALDYDGTLRVCLYKEETHTHTHCHLDLHANVIHIPVEDSATVIHLSLSPAVRESSNVRAIARSVARESHEFAAFWNLWIHYIMCGGADHFDKIAVDAGVPVVELLDSMSTSRFEYATFADLAADARDGMRIFESLQCACGVTDPLRDRNVPPPPTQRMSEWSLDDGDVAPFWLVTSSPTFEHSPSRTDAARKGYKILCDTGLGVPDEIAKTVPAAWTWLLSPREEEEKR